MRSDYRSPEAQQYRKLYKLARWCGPHGLRATRLRAEPLCRMCHADGRVTAADTVDHIKEHKGDLTLFWDYDNTQSLCSSCHSSLKQRQERGTELQAIGLDGWPI